MSVLMVLPPFFLWFEFVYLPCARRTRKSYACGSSETQCNRVLRSAVPRASEREWGLGSAASSKPNLILGFSVEQVRTVTATCRWSFLRRLVLHRAGPREILGEGKESSLHAKCFCAGEGPGPVAARRSGISSVRRY